MMVVRKIKMEYSDEFLIHYGLEGMKWGIRRWQYEDGRFNEAGKLRYFGQHSSHRPPSVQELQGSNGRASNKDGSKGANRLKNKEINNKSEPLVLSESREKKIKKHTDTVLKKFGNRKLNDHDSFNTQGSRDLKELLGIDDAEAEKLKKYAKVAGISLLTAAGIVAAGYIIAKRPRLVGKYNLDRRFIRSLSIKQLISKDIYNKDPVGYLAIKNGYKPITAQRIIDSIKNPKVIDINYDELVENVRRNQIIHESVISGMRVRDRLEFNSWRRLSCFSASQSYWLSALTGGDYVSKSFENLVNFNDFGKIYKKMPKIFTANGLRSFLFVGKFGESGAVSTEKTARSLVENIFKHISSANNLTPDGKKTIGFINAAYHAETCTHEWNFELLHNLNGTKSLIMADGYTGDRWFVGNLLSTGKVDFETVGLNKLIEELGNYNANSIRFYAPSLKSINPEVLSKLIIGKP